MEPLPPLTALRAFEAAARHQSFVQAAGELNVTAAAVSKVVRLVTIYCIANGAVFIIY